MALFSYERTFWYDRNYSDAGRHDVQPSFCMSASMLVIHIGLYVVVVIEGLAICVLYYRNNELLRVAATGNASGKPVGSRALHFKAINIRTNELVDTINYEGGRVWIIFVQMGCMDCHSLLDEISRREIIPATENDTSLFVYCDGSTRGCLEITQKFDPRIVILSRHKSDVIVEYRLPTLPAIVEINPCWNISGYSYPSSFDEAMAFMGKATIQDSADKF